MSGSTIWTQSLVGAPENQALGQQMVWLDGSHPRPSHESVRRMYPMCCYPSCMVQTGVPVSRRSQCLPRFIIAIGAISKANSYSIRIRHKPAFVACLASALSAFAWCSIMSSRDVSPAYILQPGQTCVRSWCAWASPLFGCDRYLAHSLVHQKSVFRLLVSMSWLARVRIANHHPPLPMIAVLCRSSAS